MYEGLSKLGRHLLQDFGLNVFVLKNSKDTEKLKTIHIILGFLARLGNFSGNILAESLTNSPKRPKIRIH